MSTQPLRPLKFRNLGEINYNGYKWTYYDEKEIPGTRLNIPGRHTDDNLVKDGNGNICLASGMHNVGTPLVTPILNPDGKQYIGVVYEYFGTSGIIDVYVNF